MLGPPGNKCGFPFSACATTKDKLGVPGVLSGSRDVLRIFSLQLEGAQLQDQGKGAAHINAIAKQCSALP